MSKITIVGAGRVGEAAAQFIAKEELCREVVLVDVRDGAAEGTALDIQESAPLMHFDTKLRGYTDPRAMEASELVVITAGLPRKPGMSRSDVLDANVSILDGILDEVMRHAPETTLMIVSNPVDVLTFRAWRRTGWDRRRVFGQAGVLDSARMASFVALETGFSVEDIHAMVLGGHGDSMVPMPRFTTINGISVDQFLDAPTIERIIERTRQGGAEILALKKNSSAYGAPAAAIAAMVSSIRMNRKRVLPTVSILQGEYGERDIAMGVPAVLGMGGMERVLELPLTETEQAMFSRSSAAVRADIARLPA